MMEENTEKKELVLTPEAELACYVESFCEWEGFNEALKKIKKVDYRRYVKPKDAPKVILNLLKKCDRICAEADIRWLED